MQGFHLHVRKYAVLLLLTALLLSACANAQAVTDQIPQAEQGAVPTEPAVRDPLVEEPAVQEPSVEEPAVQEPTEQQPAAEDPGQGGEEGSAPVTGDSPDAGENLPQDVPQDSVTAFPDPAGYTWAVFVSGLNQPLDLTSFPDGSGRLLILEQPGTARIYQDGNVLPEPFLDIRSRVVNQGTEQGLLGLAFHPNYAENGYFYVNYTGQQGTGDTVIARFQVSQTDPGRADPDSELILLQIQQPFRNHNGGGMVFGPDGYLYISTGDGGSADDPQNNGQRLDTLLGKLLRIDVDGGEPYVIPADNPFAAGGGEAEIWAYGLRNPWRFSFDRLTGDLYNADVGQNQWEEINFQPAGSPGGENYGWVYREGTNPYRGTPPADLQLVDPVYEYRHGLGCSVTGGFVYRGEDLPEFRGIYLFSDYCSGRVWGLLRGADGSWQSQELFLTGMNVSSFGQDENGELYLMDRSSGNVYRLQRQ
jgi:glucose/arabinose dehydrogenase